MLEIFLFLLTFTLLIATIVGVITLFMGFVKDNKFIVPGLLILIIGIIGYDTSLYLGIKNHPEVQALIPALQSDCEELKDCPMWDKKTENRTQLMRILRAGGLSCLYIPSDGNGIFVCSSLLPTDYTDNNE